MGAWFSTKGTPRGPDEAAVINSYTALTRIRILPHPNASPIVQDVNLPATAVASLDALLTFINTQPMMMISLSEYELSRDHIQLLLLQDKPGSDTVAIDLLGDDAQFGLQMDRVWVMDQRCAISILAQRNDNPDLKTGETNINPTKLATESSRKQRSEIKAGLKGLGDDSDHLCNENVGQMTEASRDTIENNEEDRFPGMGNEDSTNESVSAKMEKRHEAISPKILAEPHYPTDIPPHTMHKRHRTLSRDDAERLKSQSSSLRRLPSRQATDADEEADPKDDAIAKSLPEESAKIKAPMQSRPPNPSTAGPIINKRSLPIDDEQKAKLQQELQNKISSSLKSRGKPTSSKSPPHPDPSTSDTLDYDTRATMRSMARVDRLDPLLPTIKPIHPRGSVSSQCDGQLRHRPFTHEDWIKSQSRENMIRGSGGGEDQVLDEEL